MIIIVGNKKKKIQVQINALFRHISLRSVKYFTDEYWFLSTIVDANKFIDSTPV